MNSVQVQYFFLVLWIGAEDEEAPRGLSGLILPLNSTWIWIIIEM